MSHKNHRSLFYYRKQSLVVFFSLFLLLYPTLNLYTALLSPSQICSVATEFDQFIPFIPSAIAVYNLSGGMLVLGFFLVKNGENIARYTYRLIFATLIACLCFYLFPLRMSVDLPTASLAYQSFGINWQPAYQLLHSIDKPYNQLPSLHVAYAVLVVQSLWQPLPTFARQRTLYRFLLVIVCGAIAVSTLFTWQHHLLDTVAGVGLGLLVIWCENLLFYYQGVARSGLVLKYLGIAVVGFLLIQILPVLIVGKALSAISKGLFQLLASYWGISFGLLTFAYWDKSGQLASVIFNKNTQGKLGRVGWLLQLPIIVIYKSLWHMASQFKLTNVARANAVTSLSPSDKVSCVAIANPKPTDVKVLQRIIRSYSHVIWLDLACEMSSNFALVTKAQNKAYNKAQNSVRPTTYVSVPLLDLQPFDKTSQNEILAVIDQITTKISDDTLIICQCAMGWSRSVAMVGCLLAYFTELKPTEIRQILASHYPNHHAHEGYLNETILRFLATQNHAKIIKISSKCR